MIYLNCGGNKMDEIRKRLRIAMDKENITAKELADKTGIPKSSISQYLSGYTKPKQDRIYLISKALNVSEAWMIGYDVPMRRNDFKDVAKPRQSFSSIEDFKRAYDKSNLRLNKIESQLINNMKRLNSKGQESLLEYSNILIGNPDYSISSDNNILQAAHDRTDIEVTEEMKQHDDNIMKDDSGWE